MIEGIKNKIKVGDTVKLYIYSSWKTGYVGERTRYSFYLWQNEDSGGEGRLSPKSMGYKYSWRYSWNDVEKYEILSTSTEPITKEGGKIGSETTVTEPITKEGGKMGSETTVNVFDLKVIDSRKGKVIITETIIEALEKEDVEKKIVMSNADLLKKVDFDSLVFITTKIGSYPKPAA